MLCIFSYIALSGRSDKQTVSGWLVSLSASHRVSREFASQPGHTKDHHKNGTNCLPA